jgi:NAD(P)-dependent dehydrogenase (short-subunit alcohol dehydrogenase family)
VGSLDPRAWNFFQLNQNQRDIPIEEFEYTIRLNLTASFVLTKCLAEGMKKQLWGRIIFISSIAAYGAGLNGCRMSPLLPLFEFAFTDCMQTTLPQKAA